ncbi:hypothetical protein, partial [uncultured Desulfovibrio sp.]|uniref:hypothetical protein n=1 Tax=uncultured Desulfovibrio sp. TaxID=167968 RepID=UPI00261CF199
GSLFLYGAFLPSVRSFLRGRSFFLICRSDWRLLPSIRARSPARREATKPGCRAEAESSGKKEKRKADAAGRRPSPDAGQKPNPAAKKKKEKRMPPGGDQARTPGRSRKPATEKEKATTPLMRGSGRQSAI